MVLAQSLLVALTVNFLPPVRCDRTMVEQVPLNLSRHGIQALELDSLPVAQRVLTLAAR